MKKKTANNKDIASLMVQIQEQLAVLDRKLDAFMTKSLSELAQALAASKPAQVVHVSTPSGAIPRSNDHRPARQMYAVVCFECGKDTEIPFKPSGDRPVYCKECFAKRKSGNFAKGSGQKPQTGLIIPVSTSAPTVVTPSASKKKSASKKTVVKKKVAVKKSAKRK